MWVKQDTTPTENKHIIDKRGTAQQLLIRSVDTDNDYLQILFRQNDGTTTSANTSVALVN